MNNSAKNSVGVAFIGAGRMGLSHARTLGSISSANVIVVADPFLEAAERGKALCGAERAMSVEAFLS